MLFGDISPSDVEATTLEHPMRLFDALIKNDRLGLIALNNVIDGLDPTTTSSLVKLVSTLRYAKCGLE